jgi:hypothetical protein
MNSIENDGSGRITAMTDSIGVCTYFSHIMQSLEKIRGYFLNDCLIIFEAALVH